MKFNATIHQSGKTTTGIILPEEIVTALGGGKKPAVRVTLRGYSYPSTIGSMGGQFMIPVSAEVRAAAGVAGGDAVEVEVDLDTAPRAVTLPEDFAAALAAEPEAARFYGTLSYSNQRRVVSPIAEAKGADTRQRRIEKTVALLREGKT